MGMLGPKKGSYFHGNPTNWNFKGAVTAAVSFREGCYPPGNYQIPPGEKENHLQNGLFRGYVSSLEGINLIKKNLVLQSLRGGEPFLPSHMALQDSFEVWFKLRLTQRLWSKL